MKLRFRVGKPAAASKLMNGCGANVVPTGSIAELRSRIVIRVPSTAVKLPGDPESIVALSGVNGELPKFQVIVVGVTVMVPLILNVPVIGAAGSLALSKPPRIAVASRTFAFMVLISSLWNSGRLKPPVTASLQDQKEIVCSALYT